MCVTKTYVAFLLVYHARFRVILFSFSSHHFECQPHSHFTACLNIQYQFSGTNQDVYVHVLYFCSVFAFSFFNFIVFVIFFVWRLNRNKILPSHAYIYEPTYCTVEKSSVKSFKKKIVPSSSSVIWQSTYSMNVSWERGHYLSSVTRKCKCLCAVHFLLYQTMCASINMKHLYSFNNIVIDKYTAIYLEILCYKRKR